MSWDEEFRNMRKRWKRPPIFGFRGFEEMGKWIDEMFRDIEKSVPHELVRERKLSGGGTIKEMRPLVYGYFIKVGPDGKPIIREFGNVKSIIRVAPFGPRRSGLKFSSEREPLIDILNEDNTLKILAELPGVEKSDINLNCTETSITIFVDSPNRKYHKKLELPSRVDPKVSKASYRNGVLKITLRKAEKEKPKGKHIPVD